VTQHVPIEFMLLINERMWQSLSTRHRAILAEAAREVEQATRERVAELESAAYAFAQTKGMRVRALTSDEVAEWRACSADVLVDYMGLNSELARQLIAAYGRLRSLACCSSAPGDTPFSRR
jgi:C4-dicarboxylate-binding protein DctP